MALYRTGKASMDAQGVISGVDTKWREPLSLIRPGATMVFLTQPLTLAVINDINSDTSMTAIGNAGTSAPLGDYVILLHDSLTVDGMAQDVAETLRYYQSKETVIEDAIEFFQNFDLAALQALVAQAGQYANEALSYKNDAEASKNAANQIKNETQAIKDGAIVDVNASKEQAIIEINNAKGDLNSYIDQAAASASASEQSRQVSESAKDQSIAAKNSSEAAKTGAESARDQAQQIANSIQPGNFMTKAANLSDVADVNTAKNNLNLGVNQAPTFGGLQLDRPDTLPNSGILALRRTKPDGNTNTESRMYHEVFGGKGITTIHTSGGANANRYMQFDSSGELSGIVTVKPDRVITNPGNGFTNIGGENNNVSITAPMTIPGNTWTGFTRYNWYNDYALTGAVRGSSDKITDYRIEVYSPGVDGYSYSFYPNGRIMSNSFNGRCQQSSWGLELDEYTNAIPFNSRSINGNDGGWSPFVAGGTRASGGYQTRVALGTISGGPAAWPSGVLKMMGDTDKHRAYNFSVFGELTTWSNAPGESWGGAYTFAKNPSSDRDIKHDILYTQGKESYDRVMQWLPSMFKYNGSETQRYGLIAQDLMKVDMQYVKLVPGAPKFLDVMRWDEGKGEEVLDRQILDDYEDDTLALDANVMIADMACSMVYMGGKIEDLEARLAKLEALLNK